MIPPQINLHGLAITSVLVSLPIAIFLPLRVLLRRAIGSQWVCVLWLALLARLLMPWPLESRWSVFNHWRNQAPATIAEPLKIKVSFPKDSVHEETAPDLQPAVVRTTTESHWDPWSLADIAWLAGAALGFGVLAWRWIQTRRYAAKTRDATDERLRNIFESIPRELRRNTELRMTDALHVPTLAGIFRPQIWMPLAWPAQFTDAELRNVLLHELGHARRRDLLVQWLFAIVQCIHWFNPLVWLAARAARFDREMACDTWVLARNDADHSGYGAALMKSIQLLRAPLHGTPATVAMASSRRNLSARISGIGAFQPIPAWRGAAAAAMMIAALATATTSRIQGEESAAKPSSTAPAPDTGDRRPVRVKTKVVMITEEAWRKLCAENPGFKDFAGKFPELDSGKATASELAKNLHNVQHGAWEIPVGMKVLSSTYADQLQKMFATLANTKGVTFNSAPSFVTRSGQSAEVEAVEEFVYPTAFKPNPDKPGDVLATDFTTRNLGLTLQVTPVIGSNGMIDMQMRSMVTGFLGYLRDKDGTREIVRPNDSGLEPIFSTSTLNTSVNIPSGGTVLMGGVRLDDKSIDGGDAANVGTKWGLPAPDASWEGWEKGRVETVRHIVLVFATAEIDTPPEAAAPVQDAQIEVESKFVEIPEDAWRKLCAENPDFEDYKSSFPDLAHPKMDYSQLKDLFTQPKVEADGITGKIALLSTLSGDDMTKMMKSLNGVAGEDFLSAPSVTTKSGQRALIEVVREFRYPTEFEEDKKPVATKNQSGETVIVIPPKFTPTAFETKNVGISLEAKPELNKDGTIDLTLTPTLTGFLGFVTEENGVKTLAYNFRDGGNVINRPVFTTLSGTTSVSVYSGQTVLLGGVQIDSNKDQILKEMVTIDYVAPHPDAAPDTVRRILLAFATVRAVKPFQAAPDSPEQAAPAEPVKDSKIPHGVPVEGKPGFATSPYAPDSGPVDLRGYPRDTEVKDPYTGKTFLVP